MPISEYQATHPCSIWFTSGEGCMEGLIQALVKPAAVCMSDSNYGQADLYSLVLKVLRIIHGKDYADHPIS